MTLPKDGADAKLITFKETYGHRYTEMFLIGGNAVTKDLAQRDKLLANPDGSVDMYLQAESPGKDKEANWLPTPKGKFVLVMRIYQPRKSTPSILNGTWTPPPVRGQ